MLGFGHPPVVVLGGGIAGLAASRILACADVPFYTVEQQDGPGGLARTDVVGDFLFDRAGHFIHARSGGFRKVLRECGVEFTTFAPDRRW